MEEIELFRWSGCYDRAIATTTAKGGSDEIFREGVELGDVSSTQIFGDTKKKVPPDKCETVYIKEGEMSTFLFCVFAKPIQLKCSMSFYCLCCSPPQFQASHCHL